MEVMNKFMKVQEIKALLGCSISRAYKVMRELNQELDKKNKITIPGRVSRKYFMERFYG